MTLIRSLTLTGALATGMVLAACATENAGGSGHASVAVVATTTQVGSIAQEIGGAAVSLTVLLEPGIEAHDFEMTPAAGAAVEQAELILKSGAGLESWLDDALETIGGADRVRDLSEGVELRSASPGEREQGVDPHYWLSPPNAIAMVENARDALIAAAPEAVEGINERAAGLIERIVDADGQIRALIGKIPEERRVIVTDHDALGYFIDEYGLAYVGSVFPSLDVSADPSAQEIEDLVVAIREHDARAIFIESAVNPRLAQAVAQETGARLIADPLYTDSLGPEGSDAETLDGMLLHNARVIHDGLIGD